MEPSHSESLDDARIQNPSIAENVAPKPNEKEMNKIREGVEALKKEILSKYSKISAFGIIPPQASQLLDEENDLSEEEKKEKPLHIAVLLQDDAEKEYNSIKKDIVERIKKQKQKIWLNLFLEKDVWNIAMDGKYAVVEAIGMSFPLHDKGILAALRVSQIHKSLVLKKFEKYVYSYVIGGSVVRGEAVKSSDVDTYVIIDDTDVKRMSRMELKDKLRNIIYSYIMQAGELAGVKNALNVQVYLLTEFWEGVKDANPVFYTFLRDGVPLYDRGGFLPWKLLLKMGKIKPTPESIDMFMSYGDKTQDIVQRKLLDIVIGDIYYGVLTPSQALLMLYGLPPTNVKETVKEMKRIFVDREKLLDKKYWKILEEVAITYFKGYEHQKIKSVSGKDVDRLLKDSGEYLKKLKELRKQLDKRMSLKSFQEIYEQVFSIMRSLFGKKSDATLIREYERDIVNSGKGNPRFLKTLHSLVTAHKKFKQKKEIGKYEFENLRKDSVYLIESLVEYGQRRDLGLLQKTKVVLTFDGKHADLFLTKPTFLVSHDSIKKITKTVEDSTQNEFNQVLSSFSGSPATLTPSLMSLLKKELGNFELHV